MGVLNNWQELLMGVRCVHEERRSGNDPLRGANSIRLCVS